MADISDFFEERLKRAGDVGIAAEQIVLDPGIGFGKKSAHNREILVRLHEFQRFGQPLCLGLSRKGIICHLVGERSVEHRTAGGLGVLCHALARQAVQIARVHDVEETRDAIVAFEALGNPGRRQ